jgi:hypothetical protein
MMQKKLSIKNSSKYFFVVTFITITFFSIFFIQKHVSNLKYVDQMVKVAFPNNEKWLKHIILEEFSIDITYFDENGLIYLNEIVDEIDDVSQNKLPYKKDANIVIVSSENGLQKYVETFTALMISKYGSAVEGDLNNDKVFNANIFKGSSCFTAKVHNPYLNREEEGFFVPDFFVIYVGATSQSKVRLKKCLRRA